ncbi:Lar family restriction alleviation protein [Novosphingobium pentaromativorans]|uniref:Lar family restriction alleviation protein n=1 Tax=Novosphingobium pentaromativorans TaxID=205844 RepID=UPI000586DEE9
MRATATGDQLRPFSGASGSELKPCPFCGSRDVGYFEHVYARHFSVMCKSCGAEGPPRSEHEEAARLWNARAQG